MSQRQSRPSASKFLPQAREIAATQAQLHHHLVQLQQRVAGLLPRKALDALYGAGEIGAGEYVNLLLASGWPEQEALDALDQAHAAGRPAEHADPRETMDEPTLPEYAMPTRVPRKRAGKGPQLRGHPLD